MKSLYYKTVMVGLVCVFSASVAAQPQALNGGVITAPDGGASFVLLALGCSGLAIVARKRFKR